MSGDRDKCGLSSLLPMSCRGRAESFARRLHSRLRSLGSQDGDSSADESSWLAAHEATTAVSLQPRHNSDSDLYFHFGLLESPGSPVDEIAESEFSKLITNPADNLLPAAQTNHGIECHCPKKKEGVFSLPKGGSQDSDSSDGAYYDPEITDSAGLEQNRPCTNHINGDCSPTHDDKNVPPTIKPTKPPKEPDDDNAAKENGHQSDGIVSPVSSESTAAPPSLSLSAAGSTLSLHDDETNEYTSLEYSHTPDIPLTELHEELYLSAGAVHPCDQKFLPNGTALPVPEITTCQSEEEPQAEPQETQVEVEPCRDIEEAQCTRSLNRNLHLDVVDSSLVEQSVDDLTPDMPPMDFLDVTNDDNDDESVSLSPTPLSRAKIEVEATHDEDVDLDLDIAKTLDLEDEADEETKEACRFLQSLGSPKKEFKEVCQLLQEAEVEDEEEASKEKDSPSSEKCDGCQQEEERIPRVRRCSSLKTGKTPPGTPGRKKIVRFADVLGLDLADVRTFMDEIPKVPAAAYNDLQVPGILCHAISDPTLNATPEMQANFHLHSGPKPDKLLVPLFQQPSGQPDFLEVIKEKLVCLENAMVLDPLTFSISGTVRVRNLDFHKSVHIRYTMDGWKSFADLQATYCPNSCDGFSDTFEFLLYCHTLTVGQRLEFAARFQCKGFQYWDNNCGANYCFQCLPASTGSQYAPITGLDDTWQMTHGGNSAVFYYDDVEAAIQVREFISQALPVLEPDSRIKSNELYTAFIVLFCAVVFIYTQRLLTYTAT